MTESEWRTEARLRDAGNSARCVREASNAPVGSRLMACLCGAADAWHYAAYRADQSESQEGARDRVQARRRARALEAEANALCGVTA